MQTGERPYGHIYAWLEEQTRISHAFQQQLMAAVTLTGPDVVKKLNLPETAEWILDVGGGHGLFSIMLCQQHPQLQASVLDTPTALQTAEVNIAHHNLTSASISIAAICGRRNGGMAMMPFCCLTSSTIMTRRKI
jgi:methylase of polypeptide subunit release factors